VNPEISRGSPGIALARPSTPIRGPGLESTRFTLISRNPSFNFNSSPNRNLNTKPQTSRTFDQASRPTARIERPRIGQINLERPNAGPLAIRERGQSAIEVAKGRARWDTANHQK
jgi:alpha-beta hydrolase superfamily lysophospholipase